MRFPAAGPDGLLRPGLVRAYNAYRFRRTPRRRTAAPELYGTHMFPLDGLEAWPRLYGSSGLVQYQFVVPKGREDVLPRVIGRLRGSAVPCYLAVLKDLGPASDAPLSFPLAGWTLALDMPGDAPGLAAMLDTFDEWVVEAGGRVYLAKDGRVRPDVLAAMYRAHPGVARGPSPDRSRGRVVVRPRRPRRTCGWATVTSARPAADATVRPVPVRVRRVLLVGGSSDIGLAIVRRLAADGPVAACLLGRDRQRLAVAEPGSSKRTRA